MIRCQVLDRGPPGPDLLQVLEVGENQPSERFVPHSRRGDTLLASFFSRASAPICALPRLGTSLDSEHTMTPPFFFRTLGEDLVASLGVAGCKDSVQLRFWTGGGSCIPGLRFWLHLMLEEAGKHPEIHADLPVTDNRKVIKNHHRAAEKKGWRLSVAPMMDRRENLVPARVSGPSCAVRVHLKSFC